MCCKGDRVNVLDLFSGIGGFSLGLERAGMKTVAFCEIDPHCQKVLRKHWPNVPIFDDVKKLKGKQFKNIDLICGGFPCQNISVAGNKRGIDGNRSGLWKEFHRLIKEISPRWVIIENVANLRNLGLGVVLKDLRKIGYDAEWHIISARSTSPYCPHLRERIWIIAHPNSERDERLRSPQRVKKEITEPVNARYIADTESNRCETELLKQRSDRKTFREGVKGRKGLDSSSSETIVTNSDMPRLWRPFATEEEKSEWWAEATACVGDWWEVESGFCRVAHGLPKGLERARKERIKQLGNSVVPFIPEIIGRAIMNWEGNNE